MKILIINLDKSIFKPNSTSLANLKDYSRFFNKLFVVSWTLGKEEPIFFENRLFIYPTNSSSRFFYIFDTFKIFRKNIKNEAIDIVSSQDPFETGFAAFLISRFFKIRLHLQIHTDVFSRYFWKESILNKIRVLLAKFLIPRANCIRVVSERIKNSLIANCKLSRETGSRRTLEYNKIAGKIENYAIAVLPIFVDVKKIKEMQVKIDLRKKYSQFNFIILMASRLTKEKNIGLAIGAMEEIVKKYPKTGLIVVGSGPEKNNLKSQISNLKMNENIIVEEWIDDVISYCKTADLFLLASNYEGYGMVAIEAMAAGCPVIMTDVGLANEVLIDKKDSIVVPVGDKEKLSAAIFDLIEKPDLRKELAENAKKTLDFWPTKEKYLSDYHTSWLICKRD